MLARTKRTVRMVTSVVLTTTLKDALFSLPFTHLWRAHLKMGGNLDFTKIQYKNVLMIVPIAISP